MKKRDLLILIILIVIIVLFGYITIRFNSLKEEIDNNIIVIDMVDNNNLSLKKDTKIKLNINLFDNNLISGNKLYKWKSSDKDIATVDGDGFLETKKSGKTIISEEFNCNIIKTNLIVYDVLDIAIIIGDSRMDHFKDDNNFNETDKYEVKYLEKSSMLSNYNKLYVVSLSGMRYNWLAGEDEYRDNNATKYVEKIIKEYEDKTNDTTKYNIKLLFNLGVNDLNHSYLGNDSPGYVAEKYLEKLDDNMHNAWNSNIINNISLNIVTLFPVNDEMTDCYFKGRYNKDVEEFNQYMLDNSKYTVCDAYNEINFTEDVFRERNDKSCATRDGLHFSEEFNRKELYNYLVNVCANK